MAHTLFYKNKPKKIQTMSINERIKEFCSVIGISEQTFFSETGISQDIASLTVQDVRNLTRRFPELNKNWLLGGKGEMINQQYKGKTRSALTSQERFKELVDLMSRRGIANNQRELAEKLGYNHSYFSHLVNNRIPTNEMCAKLQELIPDLNTEYLQSGYGTLLTKDEPPTPKAVAVPDSASSGIILTQINDLMSEIAKQGDEIKKQGDRIDNVLGILKIIVEK